MMPLPNCRDYRKHLLEAARYLVQDANVNAHCVEMERSLQVVNSRLTGSTDQDWSFVTDPQWLIPIEWPKRFGSKSAHLLIGAVIKFGSGNLEEHSVSFSISTMETKPPPADIRTQISEGKAPCCLRDFSNSHRIVRRVHFDVDTAQTGVNRPRIHCQVGGQLAAQPTGINYHYCLDDYIDEPRLFAPPMDPVLVLDLLMRQFRTPLGSAFYNDMKWKALVKGSEALWLRDYFFTGSSFFGRSKRGSFYEEICSPATRFT